MDITAQNGVSEAIENLLDAAAITTDRKLIQRIIAAGVGLGVDEIRRLNLKITAAAIEEMRSAFGLFKPYRGIPKVTIFGSARTQSHDPLWQGAHDVAKSLSARGWMVVTGAGPGIMEAAATGAGPDMSLGVSIRLPFEEKPNNIVASDNHQVSMKYFFTRKLMLVKESRGFVCLPGGFGTMDETFELLTLQQTGKMVPVPIVLLDEPGGTYWTGFANFIAQELTSSGVVNPSDMDRVLITDSVSKAVDEITNFWRNYNSLRWVGDKLVLRLNVAPTEAELAELNEHFADTICHGQITRTEPLGPERKDNDRTELPRIMMTPIHRAVGDLHKLIRAINDLESAPESLTHPGVSVDD